MDSLILLSNHLKNLGAKNCMKMILNDTQRIVNSNTITKLFKARPNSLFVPQFLL